MNFQIKYEIFKKLLALRILCDAFLSPTQNILQKLKFKKEKMGFVFIESFIGSLQYVLPSLLWLSYLFSYNPSK